MESIKYIIRFLLFISIFFLASCSNFKKIQLKSVDIESVKIKGMRTVITDVEVGVFNPAKSFTIKDFAGQITRNDIVYGTYKVDPIMVEARSDEKYNAKVEVSLSPEVSFFELLSLVQEAELEEFKMNGELVVKLKGGLRKKFKFKDKQIPISDISKILMK